MKFTCQGKWQHGLGTGGRGRRQGAELHGKRATEPRETSNRRLLCLSTAANVGGEMHTAAWTGVFFEHANEQQEGSHDLEGASHSLVRGTQGVDTKEVMP